MDENKHLERLYLALGEAEDNNIYVDTVPLPQHQYDGVRFLYRQFKKGKAGVILNDPSGYGKRVQTVLFLNAVSPILSLPTLVLCPEGREDVWMHLFRQWTNIGSDITVQHGNEYTKSMCLVGTFSQLGTLARREWGILVVDDCSVSREVMRAGITARYRVWITTVDMKKNLQTFSVIYKWLYPRDRFLVEEFQCSRKQASTVLARSARLDAWLEDVVIRRRDVPVPLGIPRHIPDAPRVSKKNKDATGKKIKRSKPLPAYDDDITTNHVKDNKDIPQMNRNGELSKKTDTADEFVFDFENKTDTDKIDHDKTPSDILSGSNSIEDHSKDKLKNIEGIEDEAHMNVDLNDNMGMVNDEGNIMLNMSNSENESYSILNHDTIDSQNIIIKYDSDTPDLDEDGDVSAKKLKISNEIKFTSNKTNEGSVSEDLFPMDTEPSDVTSESLNNNSDNVNTKNNATNSNNSEILPKVTTNELDNEMKNDLSCNNELDKNNASENKTEPKLEGIELKIKQMEELAMKKFKGTFLDTII